MIIEEMGKTKVTASSIELGKCFKNNGHFYMRIDNDPMAEDYIVCVDIANGKTTEFENDYCVNPVTAKVVIE